EGIGEEQEGEMWVLKKHIDDGAGAARRGAKEGRGGECGGMRCTSVGSLKEQ
ncbi:Uncharacterized protein DAT39_005714, partial [Clarias magur]